VSFTPCEVIVWNYFEVCTVKVKRCRQKVALLYILWSSIIKTKRRKTCKNKRCLLIFLSMSKFLYKSYSTVNVGFNTSQVEMANQKTPLIFYNRRVQNYESQSRQDDPCSLSCRYWWEHRFRKLYPFMLKLHTKQLQCKMC